MPKHLFNIAFKNDKREFFTLAVFTYPDNTLCYKLYDDYRERSIKTLPLDYVLKENEDKKELRKRIEAGLKETGLNVLSNLNIH